MAEREKCNIVLLVAFDPVSFVATARIVFPALQRKAPDTLVLGEAPVLSDGSEVYPAAPESRNCVEGLAVFWAYRPTPQ